ncbi:MAG TPA: hypothetical protein VHA82_19310 [Ramlibacter sp.]|uniref:hypothetical protein n=1 Tax=Ramlibacter sp. TaxID=1917967 RepID=UPI002BB1B0CE|nr:hypothetical protein [Ramlibacter sp.]HVZ45965.1 hypothetical protein [Ramlibacter sp.]
MGYFMREHDIYVGSMLDDLNQRFAPSAPGSEQKGGIREMAELQKEFGIFKEGRALRTSVMALHLGNGANHEAKNRFLLYLASLRGVKSNVKGLKGEAAIVQALVRNFAAKSPLPVYFEGHDLRGEGEAAGVIIRENAKPLFYMHEAYLSISLPMQPRVPEARAAKKTPGKK